MADTCGLVDWLDRLLRISEIEDYPGALNGLQVEARGAVHRIGAATDACQLTIDRAITAGCELLLVHHGLFWGGVSPLVGPAYRRIAALVRSGTGLYSAHLPLDLHEEVGNNVQLAAALGVAPEGRFGEHRGVEGLGVLATLDEHRDDLATRIGAVLGARVHLIPGGVEQIRRLAIVTGGAGSMLGQAVRAGADAFLTGEGSHHTHHEALEAGINVFYAGHYATETLGVKALAERAAAEFGLEWEFFDVPTGL